MLECMKQGREFGRSYPAILFDFDGVLLDSEPVHFECWMEALKPLGIQSDWDTFGKYCIGIPDKTAVEFLCRNNVPAIDPEAAWAYYARKKELFRARMRAGPPFSEDLTGFLKSLDGYRLAVVTASARSEIEPLLERGGIRSCFQALVCREDVALPKPAPDPYLLAAKLLGVTRALVVEDSDAGVASGQAAGFEVLRVGGPSEVPRRVLELLGS
jgi:beta-phosphoglucomutase